MREISEGPIIKQKSHMAKGCQLNDTIKFIVRIVSFWPLDETVASIAVFVIVSGSNAVGGNALGAS